MEAVPAVVAVSKLMGGGPGGGGGSGVTVMEVETGSDHISIVVAPSIDRCSYKDKICSPTGAGSTFKKTLGTELCKHSNQNSNFHSEDAAGEVKFGSRNGSPLPMHNLEGKLSPSKTGKMARSSSGSYKRSRMAHMEETLQEADVNDLKGKNQTSKQKNGLSGKRSDRRKCRVMNSKCDYFSLKTSTVSFNSAPGGNSFFDTSDVTKHLDDLSLSELLDGDYKSPTFAKDKGKKATNSNENILQSISKVCSILRLHKPLQMQKSNECGDHSCNQKLSSSLVSSEATVASKNVHDAGDACAVQSTLDKESCSNPISPVEGLDSTTICQPKDILERLALTPSKDLDSVLLDAAKPSLTSRSNSDSRIKYTSHRATISPFPWSHNTGTNCKTNADAVKISASKIACQGRWAKMGNVSNSLERKTSFVADLESLNYDHNLVPVETLRVGPSEGEMGPSSSVSIPTFEFGSSPSATCPPLECQRSLKYEEDEYSPRLLTAARTLCDIRWPKKPAETTLKACKSKPSNTKSAERFAGPRSAAAATDHHHRVNSATEFLPLKKSRHSLVEKSKAPLHHTVRETPASWSVPRPTRPSPGPSSFRDSFPVSKPSSANAAKRFCLMPPPSSRIIDKARHKQKKAAMEWTRGNLN